MMDELEAASELISVGKRSLAPLRTDGPGPVKENTVLYESKI